MNKLFEPTFRSPYGDGLAGHHAGAGDTEMAAAKAATERLGDGCRDALYRLRMAGALGMTDEEGQVMQFSFPKRRCDLFKLGYIEDSGKRRKSSRGQDMIVWRIK